MRADLHCHSNASDGTRPPAEVMARARAAGLDAVALTDHDTVAGHAAAREALPAGLTLITGMEMSCRQEGRSVHMLAYLFDPSEPQLARECARIRAGRQDRAGDRRQGRAASAQALPLTVLRPMVRTCWCNG